MMFTFLRPIPAYRAKNGPQINVYNLLFNYFLNFLTGTLMVLFVD